MKSIIQKSLAIALLYYAVAISSCLDKQCNCAPVTNGKFNYTDLSTANLIYNIKGDTAFSNDRTTADTITSGQYGFQMQLEYKILAAHRKASFSFINTAYACDCVMSQFYNVDSITNITITTLNNLDATHLAGSNVNAYFKALSYDYSPQRIAYYDALSPGQYNGPHNPSVTGVIHSELLLKTPVPANQEIAFEITFTFASGNKLSAKTKPVFLK